MVALGDNCEGSSGRGRGQRQVLGRVSARSQEHLHQSVGDDGGSASESDGGLGSGPNDNHGASKGKNESTPVKSLGLRMLLGLKNEPH